MECDITNVFSQVQLNPSNCNIFKFSQSVEYLVHNFDVYSLTNVYYSPTTLFLILITVYVKISEEPLQKDYLLQFLHHLNAYLFDHSEGLRKSIEISFSEWGQHNLYGFRARDIRRHLQISPLDMLRNVITVHSFEYDDLSAEVVVTMVRLLSLSEESMMTCLNVPTIRERQDVV